jgi:hypothetical protein
VLTAEDVLSLEAPDVLASRVFLNAAEINPSIATWPAILTRESFRCFWLH